MIDAEARRRIATELGTSFIVEAAAGTGKTTALIGRMVAILRSGRAPLEAIVALTFTDKAAGEMKLRLRGELERARAEASDAQERARLTDALGALEAARIGTIHSFCKDILAERPIEAGIDPDAQVVDDASGALVERAFVPFFEARLEAPPEGIRRLLRRRGAPRTQLLRGARDLIDRRDHDAPYRFPEGFDRDAEIDALMETLVSVAALAQLARDSTDYLLKSLVRVAVFVEETMASERSRARDYDGIEAELSALRRGREWTYKGRGRYFGKDLLRADVLIRRDACAAEIDRFLGLANADLAAHLRRDLWPVVEDYERLKVRAGKLDFLDLLILTRDLIRDQADVRAELRERFQCIFVDEFQDTDPLQAEILSMLASEGPLSPDGALADDAPPPLPGKLFVVGDPKQAIYGFRRADVSLYERLKRRWMAQGLALLELATSFRARPAIQRAINAAFEPHMTGPEDGSQATYVALAEHRPANPARPALIALPTPQPYADFGKITGKAVSESTPDAVAAFVEWLLESDWTLQDAITGEERSFESRDVCLLFRNTTGYGRNLVQPYALGLEARSIPHVLIGGRAFRDREEILAFLTVIRAIEYPSDALSVYGTLRGPFFGCTDDALLVHRNDVGPWNPLVPLGEALFDEAKRPVAEALDILRELHIHRGRRPIADTLARFLDATRAHAGIAHWPNGEQALANLLRVLDLARRFESNGAGSFRGFAEHLEERIERGEGVDTPVVEERAEGVRVMTVHKAKGLEFPVVVLCDPTLARKKKGVFRSSFVDSTKRLWASPLANCAPLDLLENEEQVLRKEEAEEIRLSYVAATRARELLVVPCVGDEAVEGWVDPLHRALYPSGANKREPTRAPGCPEFGDDTVVDWPPRAERDASSSVAPGLHRGDFGEVVWWDPKTLKLGRVPRMGLRRSVLLGPGDDGDEQVEAHYAWQEGLAETRERGATQSWKVRPVTAVAHEREETTHRPTIEETDAPRLGRPSGKRFGTLVHTVLSECALDAAGGDLQALARHFGRQLHCDDDEIDAAAGAAAATLRHPRLIAARASGEVRRESPITVPLDDGTSAEGVIDLCYRTDAGWVVLDYKSDREVGAKQSHAAQLEIYAKAVGQATGLAVETVVLFI